VSFPPAPRRRGRTNLHDRPSNERCRAPRFGVQLPQRDTTDPRRTTTAAVRPHDLEDGSASSRARSTKEGATMRNLTHSELQAVSGGLTIEGDGPAMTLALMALCPTPLVIGVGAVALLVYAWC
jgi:hypothetical protein